MSQKTLLTPSSVKVPSSEPSSSPSQSTNISIATANNVATRNVSSRPSKSIRTEVKDLLHRSKQRRILTTVCLSFVVVSSIVLAASILDSNHHYQNPIVPQRHLRLDIPNLNRNEDRQDVNSNISLSQKGREDGKEIRPKLTKHRKQEESTTPSCNQTTSDPSSGWVTSIPPGVQYTLITILILFSAFFSGLTLSMMGLDTTGLEIVMSGDDASLSRAAGKIYPVRKNGNLLLCTLLLGNVAVNTLLGILMADITGGTVGFLTSTALIVIFGEILPQVSLKDGWDD